MKRLDPLAKVFRGCPLDKKCIFRVIFCNKNVLLILIVKLNIFLISIRYKFGSGVA
jgi:hypothetical protein